MNGVFAGPTGLQKYLHPDNHPPLPLVELPVTLNHFAKYRVRVLVKLMGNLPLGNVKSLPAYQMLETASETGQLEGVESLVEASSGNTVLSLAVTARAMYGIDRTVAVASNEVERGKLNLLRLLGTTVRVVEEDICPDPTDPTSAPNLAKAQACAAGWYCAGQYENLANPEAHRRWTGPQIWEQTEGAVTVLAAGLGTCGTVIGTGSYLKSRNPKLAVVGVIRHPNNPVPGVRTEGLLREIAFDWPNAVDNLVPVGTVDAYRQSADCCRRGLLIGPSAGFALQGLYQQVQQWIDEGTIDDHRNQDGDVLAVVIAPDGPLAYLDEYFRYLPADYFPPIEHEELLIDRGGEVDGAQRSPLAPDVLSEMSLSSGELSALLHEQPEDVVIIDVRDRRAFDDHHIAGAVWLPATQLADHLEIVLAASALKGRAVVFVCQFGAQSVTYAARAQLLGFTNVKNLNGGMTQWSRLGLSRVRPDHCVVPG